jgi:hypothetical protein
MTRPGILNEYGASGVVLMWLPRWAGRFGADCFMASISWAAVSAWISWVFLTMAIPTSWRRPVSAMLVASLAIPIASICVS